MNLFISVAVILCVLLLSRAARACTTVVVGRAVSSTGFVMVGHNEDDPGRLTVRHGFVPRRLWAQGSSVLSEAGSARLPQSGESCGFFWTEVRGEAGFLTADCFVNDCGVTVVSNSCVESRRDNEHDLYHGGLGYGLRRALAEGATSAAGGVKIAVDLLNRYGYRFSGRSYVIADAQEAWILQVVHGKDYCAMRLADDEVAFIPNHYTIRSGDLANHPFVLSPGTISKSIERHWCDSDTTEATFDFAQAMQDPDSWRVDGNTFRHRHGLARFTGQLLSADAQLPLAIKPGRSVTPDDVRAVLKDHYEGTDDDMTIDFAGSSPHYTPRRRICTGGTVESTVALLHQQPELTELQLAAGRPCFQPWQTFLLTGALPKELNPLDDAAEALHRHCDSDIEQLAWKDSGWCDLFADQTLMDLLYSSLSSQVHRWVAHRQAELDDAAEKMRRHMTSLLAEGRKDDATDYVTAETARLSAETVRQRKELLAAYQPATLSFDVASIDKADPAAQIIARFDSSTQPDEASLRLGQGGTAPMIWASPIVGSLTEEQAGQWAVAFRVRELTEKVTTVHSEFWLGGRDQQGEPLAAKGFLTVKPAQQRETFQGKCSL